MDTLQYSVLGIGFGIDDLVLDADPDVVASVPAPGTISFLAFGLAWMIRRRSRA